MLAESLPNNGGFLNNFTFPVKLHVCAVRTWKYGALLPLRPRIWQPLLCVWVLLVEYRVSIRREMPL